MSEPRIFTIAETAKYLKISAPTCYALIRQESFPSFHIGNRVLVDAKLLDEWIETQAKNKMFVELD